MTIGLEKPMPGIVAAVAHRPRRWAQSSGRMLGMVNSHIFTCQRRAPLDPTVRSIFRERNDAVPPVDFDPEPHVVFGRIIEPQANGQITSPRGIRQIHGAQHVRVA